MSLKKKLSLAFKSIKPRKIVIFILANKYIYFGSFIIKTYSLKNVNIPMNSSTDTIILKAISCQRALNVQCDEA